MGEIFFGMEVRRVVEVFAIVRIVKREIVGDPTGENCRHFR